MIKSLITLLFSLVLVNLSNSQSFKLKKIPNLVDPYLIKLNINQSDSHSCEVAGTIIKEGFKELLDYDSNLSEDYLDTSEYSSFLSIDEPYPIYCKNTKITDTLPRVKLYGSKKCSTDSCMELLILKRIKSIDKKLNSVGEPSYFLRLEKAKYLAIEVLRLHQADSNLLIDRGR